MGSIQYGTAKEYGTDYKQHELLKLMKKVHAFCVEHNIKYSLNSGSLLGAIRHNGFIPWDDDMDIMMDRDNYIKFTSCAKETECFRMYSDLWINRITNDSTNNNLIDILVLDNAPDSRLEQKLKLLIIKLLQGMMKINIDYSRYKGVDLALVIITHYMGKPFSYHFKYNLYKRVSQIGNKHETRYKCIYNNLFSSIGRKYNSKLMEDIELHTFEDTEFFITSRFNEYLESVYGDYMTPPSIEDRKKGNYDIFCNGKVISLNSRLHA